MMLSLIRLYLVDGRIINESGAVGETDNWHEIPKYSEKIGPGANLSPKNQT
jgi:hypothetical protein